MIDDSSLRAVAEAQWHGPFVKPLYQSYCFSQVPSLVRSLFDRTDQAHVQARLLGPLAGDYDTVILFFVDAFGWRFFDRYRERSAFLQRIVDEGHVCKLTSQFPSTTAAHVTAIHTGAPVGQSGVYEWFYYEPLVDAVIAPLYYSFAGDRERDTLARTHVSPTALFPERTLYQDLQDRGVRSFLFQHREYTPSPYTDTVSRGAQVVPYTTLPEGLSTLLGLASEARERTYIFLYFDRIDAICHRYGPGSPQTAAEIGGFLATMDAVFHAGMASSRRRTLVLLIADHGQVEIDPATTIYLNLHTPDVTRYLKAGGDGRLLVPVGSPRDMFLHVEDDLLGEAQAYLADCLEGRAEVHRVADLIEHGFFGPRLSPAFLGRVGDLVILPYAGESVWWYEEGKFEQGYYGHHGGLTRAEMETLLLARPYVSG